MLIDTIEKNGKQVEVRKGLNGSGETTWHVSILKDNGSYEFTHVFNNEAEAYNWIEWCI